MMTLEKNDIEFMSSDYEEDGYLEFVRKSDTPSFDKEEPITESLLNSISSNWSATSFVIAEDDDEDGSCSVETEFVHKRNIFNKKNTIKDVRVKFQDLSKPYLARITNNENYLKFLHLVKGEDSLGDSLQSPTAEIEELKGLTPEEQDKQKKAWEEELVGIEAEIQTLRNVLSNRIKIAHELKRKLGISVWKEWQEDMSQGIRNVKESNVYQNVEEKFGQFGKAVVEAPLYQKTESVIKPIAERTTSIIGGFGSGITVKLGQLKNSESFRSLEEKVGSAYENVLTRVGPRRSVSIQSFNDTIKEDEARRTKSASHTPASTPTIPE